MYVVLMERKSESNIPLSIRWHTTERNFSNRPQYVGSLTQLVRMETF